MTELAVRGRPFPPGVSGNPNGRPLGHHTRHQFSNAFMDDLAATWAEYGLSAMQRTARENPQTFFATCARILPQNVAVTVQQNYANALNEIDLAILKASYCRTMPMASLRQRVFSASSRTSVLG